MPTISGGISAFLTSTKTVPSCGVAVAVAVGVAVGLSTGVEVTVAVAAGAVGVGVAVSSKPGSGSVGSGVEVGPPLVMVTDASLTAAIRGTALTSVMPKMSITS